MNTQCICVQCVLKYIVYKYNLKHIMEDRFLPRVIIAISLAQSPLLFFTFVVCFRSVNTFTIQKIEKLRKGTDSFSVGLRKRTSSLLKTGTGSWNQLIFQLKEWEMERIKRNVNHTEKTYFKMIY